MGRNNEDFVWFHVSPKRNRESIEREGLKAQTVWNGEDERSPDFYEKGPGVWVSGEPEEDYGDDVYGIKSPEIPGTSNEHPIAAYRRPLRKHETETDDEGHEFIPHDVPISDFKRVGHIYQNPNGHTEVHWHKEEDCPND